jgi:hypothetical protein
MTTRHLARNDRETDDTGEKTETEKKSEKNQRQKKFILCASRQREKEKTN